MRAGRSCPSYAVMPVARRMQPRRTPRGRYGADRPSRPAVAVPAPCGPRVECSEAGEPCGRALPVRGGADSGIQDMRDMPRARHCRTSARAAPDCVRQVMRLDPATAGGAARSLLRGVPDRASSEPAGRAAGMEAEARAQPACRGVRQVVSELGGARGHVRGGLRTPGRRVRVRRARVGVMRRRYAREAGCAGAPVSRGATFGVRASRWCTRCTSVP